MFDRSPIRLLVILQKLAPEVLAGVESGNDRVNDARYADRHNELFASI